jgi:hypothetical protein
VFSTFFQIYADYLTLSNNTYFKLLTLRIAAIEQQNRRAAKKTAVHEKEPFIASKVPLNPSGCNVFHLNLPDKP